MYKCNDCNREFSEPLVVKEVHYECVELPYELFFECPYCGGSFIENNTEE